jgi:hypothetical protein
MSETQWFHTLHISLNHEKQDSLISQIKVSGFTYNSYYSNFRCSGFKTELSSFY